MAFVRIAASDPADSNVYLVTGDSCILVDTGLGRDPSRLIGDIRSELRGRSLEAVVLTHCHADHVGGLREVMDAFGCDALAYPDDAAALRGGSSRLILDRMFGFDMGGLPVDDIGEGSVLDIGEHRLEVVHTPGHTAGSLCLHDSVTGALISGDTLFSDGIGRTDLPGGSSAAMARSLLRLRSLDIKGLYPGHGRAVDDGGPCLELGLKVLGVV